MRVKSIYRLAHNTTSMKMSDIAIIAFAVILIGAILVVIGNHLLGDNLGDLDEGQARTLAQQELEYSYPNAEVNIYSLENSTGTWKIKGKVIYGAGTACPNLTIVELHYPRFGFVPREQVITSNCSVLGCKDNPNCLIAYEEEAVIISRERNSIPSLESFLSGVSPADLSVNASFHSSYQSEKMNQTYPEVWVVDWKDTESKSVFTVVLNNTGGGAVASYYKS